MSDTAASPPQTQTQTGIDPQRAKALEAVVRVAERISALKLEAPELLERARAFSAAVYGLLWRVRAHPDAAAMSAARLKLEKLGRKLVFDVRRVAELLAMEIGILDAIEVDAETRTSRREQVVRAQKAIDRLDRLQARVKRQLDFALRVFADHVAPSPAASRAASPPPEQPEAREQAPQPEQVPVVAARAIDIPVVHVQRPEARLPEPPRRAPAHSAAQRTSPKQQPRPAPEQQEQLPPQGPRPSRHRRGKHTPVYEARTLPQQWARRQSCAAESDAAMRDDEAELPDPFLGPEALWRARPSARRDPRRTPPRFGLGQHVPFFGFF